MNIETASLSAAEDPQNRQALDTMMSAFEAFKQANDERLAELEARQAADVLLEEKVDRLNTRLGDLHAAAQRPPLGGSDDNPEGRQVFADFVRKGALSVESKATLQATTDSSNSAAVFVPDHFETQLNDDISAASPLVRLARNRIVSSGQVKVVSHAAEAAAAWIGETGARPATATPDVAALDVTLGELYANPAVTQRFFDDTDLDVEDWLRRSLALSFADKENESFVSGDGINKPTGLTMAAADEAPSDSQVALVKTGLRAKLPANKKDEWLLKLAFTLAPTHRGKAAWLMNTAVLAELRKVKDGDNNYVWTPGFADGRAGDIFGYPVFDEPNMPALTASSKPIAFGDFERAYLIVRKANTQLIRDPYSNKPFIHFYATRHVGGRVVDPKAFVMAQASA